MVVVRKHCPLLHGPVELGEGREEDFFQIGQSFVAKEKMLSVVSTRGDDVCPRMSNYVRRRMRPVLQCDFILSIVTC
jgi:hypothetical protein